MQSVRWYHLYFFGIKAGLSCLRSGETDLALRSLFNPLRSGFTRYIEIPYAINALRPGPQDRILDIGSPKHIALFLRACYSSHVTAIDILPDFRETYGEYERRLGLSGISWEVQDARELAYPDGSFDKVYSVSALEHIPGDGDILAVKEMSRVLRPGGTCVITVPCGSREEDVYVDSDVYERRFSGQPVFFQRFYDEHALAERIMGPSGLEERNRQCYRSRWHVSSLWDKLPRRLQMSLLWAGPVFARLGHGGIESAGAAGEKWHGLGCLTLGKSADPPGAI